MLTRLILTGARRALSIGLTRKNQNYLAGSWAPDKTSIGILFVQQKILVYERYVPPAFAPNLRLFIREQCAIEVFGSKKTYQALKGCYERNFNLFKQIYAFESFHAHAGNLTVSSLSEADRLREYERRLQTARKAGCDVGNITARTIDHWHRVGWYDLFYRR